MPRSQDYVPRKDAEFDNWFENVTNYVIEKGGGGDPEWNHIPPEVLAKLETVFLEWRSAYDVCLKPHVPSETTMKNLAKKAALDFIRPFVQQYLLYPPVKDPDRDNMSIPRREKSSRPVETPPSPPVFTIKPVDSRLVRIDFRAKGSKGRAKPYGCTGAVVQWAVLDRDPSSANELTHYDMATRTPFYVKFENTDRGKRFYAALYWQNTRGEKGPLSDILFTVVP